MSENETAIKILDHGYLKLIESWGSDEKIIEAARMSTNKGFQGWGPKHSDNCPSQSFEAFYKQKDMPCNCEPKTGDEKLLRYLYEHKHATPFEMAGMVIEVQAPIFVFREWHRHRTQSYNEMSARYTQMPDVHYVPSVERIMQGGQDTKNKQGSGMLAIDYTQAENIRMQISSLQAAIYTQYSQFLGVGLAKELARINTPVSRYSRMRASANLRNWLAFLTLRMDKAAQWEIRQYAEQVSVLISHLFPRTWELFIEGKER
jgi:thymidylate synthase (FAD)